MLHPFQVDLVMCRLAPSACRVGFHYDQSTSNKPLQNVLYRAPGYATFSRHLGDRRIRVSTLIIRTVSKLEQYELFIARERSFPNDTADVNAHRFALCGPEFGEAGHLSHSNFGEKASMAR